MPSVKNQTVHAAGIPDQAAPAQIETYVSAGRLRPTLPSGLQYDPGAVRNDAPYLIHLTICHSNTPVRPINHAMETTQPTESVLHPMDHDQTSGIYASRPSGGNVSGSRIGNVQSLVKGAAGISVVQPILAFGRTTVALLLLLTYRMSAQGYPIHLEQVIALVQLKTPRWSHDAVEPMLCRSVANRDGWSCAIS